VVGSSDIPEHGNKKGKTEALGHAGREFNTIDLELCGDVKRVEKVTSQDERVDRGVLLSHSRVRRQMDRGHRVTAYHSMYPARGDDHRIPLH
jgi:hypothetical protein